MDEYNNIIIREDVLNISKYPLDWSLLKNKTVLVTGATGMLAKYIIYTLLFLNENKKLNIKIVALARSENKIKESYASYNLNANFHILIQDVCDEISYREPIDYIFHMAGNANTDSIVNKPVDIIKANTIGTINVFELARKTNCSKVIFASTREVYGEINSAVSEVDETMTGYIDPLDERSCYPESKKMAENICKSYSIQYGIKYNILRIAHVYGPGMNIFNDGRIMSDLIYYAVNKLNISLKSDGQDERAFCYITDAINGIFTVIFNGKENEVYNLANESEPHKIIDVANLIANLFPEKQLFVKVNKDPLADTVGYCKFKRKKMSTQKLENIGWKPIVNLETGLYRTILSYRLTNDNNFSES
jgi:nucleoside-diphosphate-sugar epimerase